MKTLTTILLTLFIAISCKGQEPDVECYSIGYVDSLQNRIALLEMIVNSNESTVIADTFNFEITGNGVKIEVNKEAKNVWIDIIDDYKRINADYFNGERSAIIMDSTYSVGSIHIRK